MDVVPAAPEIAKRSRQAPCRLAGRPRRRALAQRLCEVKSTNDGTESVQKARPEQGKGQSLSVNGRAICSGGLGARDAGCFSDPANATQGKILREQIRDPDADEPRVRPGEGRSRLAVYPHHTDLNFAIG